jgi:hypothetical protein
MREESRAFEEPRRIRGQDVTPHEFTLWQTLRAVSPVGRGETDEVTAIARLTGLSEDEVLIGLGGLLARGLIKHMGGRTREWFLALPDPSRPS